mgnify:CR=1 FL=1
MPEIKIKSGESLDHALRRLKKKVDSEGIVKELKKRSHYEKPSARRKHNKQAAKYRAKMKAKHDKWYYG